MKPTTIETYIATLPEEVRPILKKVRATIRKAAPRATESISYQIPAFHLDGKYLIYFAGFKKHIGVYPIQGVLPELKDALAPYLSGKASARFPLDKPIPYGLITRIVKAKAKAIAANPKVKKTAKKVVKKTVKKVAKKSVKSKK